MKIHRDLYKRINQELDRKFNCYINKTKTLNAGSIDDAAIVLKRQVYKSDSNVPAYICRLLFFFEKGRVRKIIERFKISGR